VLLLLPSPNNRRHESAANNLLSLVFLAAYA